MREYDLLNASYYIAGFGELSEYKEFKREIDKKIQENKEFIYKMRCLLGFIHILKVKKDEI